MRRSQAVAQPRVDEAVRGVPAPPLRPFVAWYSGYRQAGVPPAVHRGLPSPYLTVIFTLDDPLVIARHVDPRQPPGSYRVLVGGLHTSPALIAHDGRQSGVQLQLSPLGARALLGMPAGELAGIDLRLTDDGRWFCFEVNPSPGFTYYEQATGQPIARSIARLLARTAADR